VQVPASATTSQGTTAAERTQQSHHEKPQPAAAHPTPAAHRSPLFIRTYSMVVIVRCTIVFTDVNFTSGSVLLDEFLRPEFNLDLI